MPLDYMVSKIILANPRGFCAGVERAVGIVERALELYGSPIYVRHQIVHNQHVVSDLERKGAIFVEDFSEVPEGSYVILSAHGSPPNVKDEAENKGLRVIDAVCPLVTKVHLEAARFSKEGYSVILIGHRNHQEVKGTMGYADVHLVENVDDAEKVKMENPDKVAYLTQTTLSIDDTAEIVDALRRRFPNIISAPKGDICYATQNRQNAVKELAKIAELIIVVGAANSSNSNRLGDTAKRWGVESYLIPDSSGLNGEWYRHSVVGITSGASVPETLVKEVVDSIKKHNPNAVVENLDVIKENIHFPMPREIQNP